MDAGIFDLAAGQHGVFTRRQARRAGLDRNAISRRLANGSWIALNGHVFRVSGAPVTDRLTVMATVLSGGSGAVSSGTTALALREFRGFRLLPARAIVARRPPAWVFPGVSETFRLEPHHRTTVDGIPTATPARALFDLAADISPLRLARSVDTVLAARGTTVADLVAIVDEMGEHGRAGTVAMREVLRTRSVEYVAPATVLESTFLALVRERGIAEPARQVDLGGRLAWIGRVDFLWRAERVVVETDGREFHHSVSDRDADERRDRAMEAAGWTVLRFSWIDVTRRPTSVMRTLRAALVAAA
jgi:very-short-patch-repair endonuclease